jgi:hypothetical protein
VYVLLYAVVLLLKCVFVGGIYNERIWNIIEGSHLADKYAGDVSEAVFVEDLRSMSRSDKAPRRRRGRSPGSFNVKY